MGHGVILLYIKYNKLVSGLLIFAVARDEDLVSVFMNQKLM